MKDQAEKLRELASLAKRELSSDLSLKDLSTDKQSSAKVIAVTSGKGGVGKSNLSANLAITLSKQGKKVALFDADLGLANIDVILGMSPRYNLTHVVKGVKKISDVLQDGPEGIKIVAGGSGVHELAQLSLEQIDKLTNSLSFLEEEMDLIIIDTGAGLSSSVLNFVLAAHEIIVVTIPEPTAIADAYGIIKTIYSYNSQAEINLLTNRVINRKEAEQVVGRINNVAKQFLGKEVNWLGYVVDDSKVSMAVRQQQPFSLLYPRCQANICLQKLAENIIEKCFSENMQIENKNFFQRLFTLWN